MSSHWNIAPRYTPGSPAQIEDSRLAERLARQEREAYEDALVSGGEEAERARRLGLRGIVEVWTERWDGWEVWDLITDHRQIRRRGQ